MARKFTDITVRQLPSRAARYETPDPGKPGLYVVTQPSGSKSWAFRYRFNRTPCKLTLGSYPAMTLAAAHDAADAANDALVHGKDPNTKRRDVEGSVAALAALYDAHHIASLRPGTQSAKRRVLAAIIAAWGSRAVASINRKDVVKLINAVTPNTANTINERAKNIAAFLQWCIDQGELEFNPAARIKRRPTPSRERVLDDAELAAVWRQAEAVNGRYGALVRLLILTGARRDEIASLRWSEVKADAIELPGERTKTGRPHVIALTPAMRSILDTFPRHGEYVLNGDYKVNLSEHSRPKLDAPGVAPWTLHDLRRTFRTGLARLGVAPGIAERCTGHKRKSGVEAIYDRYEYAPQMRTAWELWSAHVEAIVK